MSRCARERGSVYHAGNSKERQGLPEEKQEQERLISEESVSGKQVHNSKKKKHRNSSAGVVIFSLLRLKCFSESGLPLWVQSTFLSVLGRILDSKDNMVFHVANSPAAPLRCVLYG